MTYSALVYVNELNGILATRSDGVQEYLAPGSEEHDAVIASGASISAYVPVVATVAPVNVSCTPAQMRIALHRLGELSNVEALVQSNTEAQIAWDFAPLYHRSSPIIAALAAGNYTEAEIDGFFDLAVTIQT